MVKKIIFILVTFLSSYCLNAQPFSEQQDAADLANQARTYINQFDYANAIMVFNQAIQLAPKNLMYRRELAHAYYLQGDMLRGKKMIVPLLKSDEADEETFLVAGQIYSRMKRLDEAKSALKKGIDKFPTSGILYASKGELFTSMKRYKDAVEVWEKGIKNAPSYHLNYFNLCKAYFLAKKYVWAIIYGETYVNLESFSSRTEEVKKIVFESYKFLIAELNNMALNGKVNKYANANSFEESILQVFDGLRNIVTGGIDVDNITMLRTRFLLTWNKKHAKKFPFELFDFQQRTLQKGFYTCYNHWLFGRLSNEKNYKTWTQQHATTMNQFDTYFRNKKLKPRLNQYYKSK